MSFEIEEELDEIPVYDPDVLRCEFCGQYTSDWWFSNRKLGVCRCRACADRGLLETDQEQNAKAGFTPVYNRDLFQPDFLLKKKSPELVVEDRHILRFAETGSLMEFSPRFVTRQSFSRTWKRGEIAAFSRRSRSRLNKKISTLSRHALPFFVTLTYHEQIPDSFEGYKHHLDHFFISLLRKFPKAGVIWKLEYQWRGYAHYHMFVFGVDLDQLREFVPLEWHKIAGYGSEDHLKFHQGLLGNGNEHCVQPIRSWNGVKYYASKYLAKVENDVVGGRVWGVRGSHLVHVGEDEQGKPKYKRESNLPLSKILEFRVSLELALEFRAAVARKLNFEFQRLGFWCANYDVDWLLYFWELDQAEYVASRCPDDPPEWEDYVECGNLL